MEAKMRNIALIILTAVFAAMLTGCYTQPNPPEQPQQLKIQLSPMEQEIVDLQEKIEANFSNPKPHYELGQLYRKQASWDKALNQFNLAMQFDPGYKRAQAATVKTHFEQGNDTKAELLADIYINQASNSAEGLLILGRAFEDEGLDDYAFRAYDKAVMLAPNSAVLHRQMGYYYKRKGETIRAEEAFKRSFQLDPYNADVAGELGKMGVLVEIPRMQEKNADLEQAAPDDASGQTQP